MKLESAFAKVEAYLSERDTRPGILARQLVGKERPGDPKLADLLVNERRARTRMDGSIDGSLVRTSWAAWEMMDLGADPLHGGLDRLVSWILAQVEAGTATDPAPLVLPNGAAIADPEGAAFAARCLGLRVVLRARREERPAIQQLVDQLANGPQPPTLDLSACALAALALVPPPHRRHLDGLVHRLGRAQGGDGAWADADLFHMLEALVLAGIRPARQVVARAAPALVRRLRDDGAFDDPPHDHPIHEERALIGLRALAIALEE
ncbi:MAG TPA: hypothetical protein VNI61_12730 [Gemmatimonadales bacterium]|nr:hypothetical protein [Gemmatimonadales bacterium]